MLGTTVVAFEVADEIGRVHEKFIEALWPLAGVELEERPGVSLRLGRPEAEDAGGSRAAIAVAGQRLTLVAVPSSWAPECLIEGWETKAHDLGPVMRFRFTALRGGAHVTACCSQRFAPLQPVFDDLLKRIQRWCPVVGPLTRESVAQPIEGIEEYLQARVAPVATAPAAAAPADAPKAAVGDAKAGVQRHSGDETESAQEREDRGPKAGTYERVREAHRLITRLHLSRSKAFKRAKTDSRTYDRWCKAATGDEPVAPYTEP